MKHNFSKPVFLTIMGFSMCIPSFAMDDATQKLISLNQQISEVYVSYIKKDTELLKAKDELSEAKRGVKAKPSDSGKKKVDSLNESVKKLKKEQAGLGKKWAQLVHAKKNFKSNKDTGKNSKK